MKKPNRTTLLSNFCYFIGGFNASENSYGRLGLSVKNVNDDNEVVEYLLSQYKYDVTHRLEKEIVELKAKLFDLQNK